MIPRDYQLECEAAVWKHIDSGSKGVLCALATGLGKAQPLDAKILTPTGFSKMGEMRVGSKVIGSDGKPCEVTGVYPQGIKEVFRVTFSDTTSTRCCGDHLWSLQTKSQKCRGSGFETIPLKDIGSVKDGAGSNRWFLPVVSPVEFNSCQLEIDPYLIGMFLGNGCLRTSGVKLSTGDEFVVNEVKARLPVGYTLEPACGRKYDWNVLSHVRNGVGVLNAFLRDSGLQGLYSYEKFIPEEYKYSSATNRLEVLRGLLDSDGHIRPGDRHIEFSSTSKRLADDVCELVRSLGGCTSVKYKPPASYTYKGQKLIGRESYRVTVNIKDNPFKVPRKRDLFVSCKKQGRTKAIESVVSDGVAECQCISVSASNGLYVTDDYTLTHNTAISGMLASKMDKMLFIVDREELAFQAQRALQSITGRRVALECGPEYKAYKTDPGAKFVVAMSQSLIRRLSAYSSDRFDYIIEDECFPAGTMVGNVPIESIQPGDFVDSFNHSTNQVEKRIVVRTSNRKPQRLMRVGLDSGEVFYPTPEHPFYAECVRDRWEYRAARLLQEGTRLRSREGSTGLIESVHGISPTSCGTYSGVCPDGRVYNLEVEGNHNYFVNGFLVHNCHHSVAATRTRIRTHFSGSRAVVGLSATPKRSDGQATGKVYDTVAFSMDCVTGIDLGWLTPFKSHGMSCTEMDLRDVTMNAGEFNQAMLRVQTEKEAVVQRIAEQTVRIADGRQTVIFAQTVKQSEAINRYLRSIGERSTHVDGKLPRFVRRERLSQFSKGGFQIICNCSLIEEGVDVPGIEVVAMAAPIRSTVRFIQRCGRGLRPVVDDELSHEGAGIRRKQIASSGKPWCTIIDFIGQMDDHSSSMCLSGDLLGGEFDDEERKVAIRLASGREVDDMPAIMAEAKEIVAKRRAKLSVAQQKIEARRRYQQAGRVEEQNWSVNATFHPYDVMQLDRKEADRRITKDECYGRSLSSAVKYLEDNKLTAYEIRILSNREQVYLALCLRERATHGATYVQCRKIHARGYPAGNMTKARANELIGRITAAGYVRPIEDGPNELYEKYKASKVAATGSKNFTFI